MPRVSEEGAQRIVRLLSDSDTMKCLPATFVAALPGAARVSTEWCGGKAGGHDCDGPRCPAAPNSRLPADYPFMALSLPREPRITTSSINRKCIKREVHAPYVALVEMEEYADLWFAYILRTSKWSP